MNGKPAYAELEQRVKELEKAVADSRRTKEMLQKSEQDLEVTLNSIGDAMIATDADGKILRMNPVAEKLTGWKIGKAKKRLLSEVFNIINGKTRKPAKNPVDKVLREGKVVGLANHTLLISKDGTEYQIADSGAPIRAKDGSIRGVVLVFRDVTQEYHIQQSLKESEEKYKLLFNCSFYGTFVTDFKGKVLAANDFGASALGFDRVEDLIGMSITDHYKDPKERERAIDIIKDGGSTLFEAVIKRKDGMDFTALLSMGSLELQGEKVVLMSGIDITERKKAEEALRESEERFRELADLLPQPVFETNAKGDITFFNRSVLHTFGYNAEDYKKGLNIRQLVDSQAHDTLIAKAKRIWKTGKSSGNRYTLVRKDGSPLPAMVHSNTIIHEDRVVGLRGVFMDLTEIKEAEKSLRESEQIYRSIFENTGSATVILEEDMTIAMANSEFERLTGHSKREIEGRMKPTPFVFKEDRARLAGYHAARRSKEPKEETEYEFRFVDKNKNIKNVLARGALIPGTQRSVISLMDITLRKRTEEALRSSEATLRAMLNATPDGVILADLDGTIVACNDGLPNLLGTKKEELIGKNIHKVIPEKDIAEYRKTKADEVIQSGRPVQFDDMREERKIHHSIYPVHDAHGNVTQTVSYSHDFTRSWQENKEKEALKEKLVRSKKMEAIGLMAGGVAHDLNNILTGIVTYPELLLMEIPEESKLRKSIETIQKSGQRAAAVVADLLTVARGVAIGQEVVDLNRVIERYLLSAEYNELELKCPTVSVKTRLDSGLLNIRGSTIHLEKSLMNLVLNAMEAVEDNGNIVISTTNRYLDKPLKGYDDVRIGEYAVLAVSDDGPGISSDDLKRIFEPFYTKKVMGRSGTGLGLTVVWNTVRDNRGYIDVRSGDSGTSFELYFPITREESIVEEQRLNIEDYMGNGERILVVDDEAIQRDLACKFLTRLGYSVNAVSSGEKAVAYLKEHAADLVMLDMIMDPGINGRETYERIIKIHPQQKAIIVSGFSESEEVKKTQKIGAGQYIKKPYLIEKLGIAVRDELKKGS